MRYLFLSLVFVVSGQIEQATASPKEVMRATCRVYANYERHGDERRMAGTGIVVGETDKIFRILTAGHVIDDVEYFEVDARRGGKVDVEYKLKSVQVQFFTNGFPSELFAVHVVWKQHEVNKVKDLALITVDKKLFKHYPKPKPIPLASAKTVVGKNQRIFSCGCADARWPTLWMGHVRHIYKNRFEFHPDAISGRSGSAIFDEKCTKVIGIIIWKDTEDTDGGTAISISEIYKQIKNMTEPI